MTIGITSYDRAKQLISEIMDEGYTFDEAVKIAIITTKNIIEQLIRLIQVDNNLTKTTRTVFWRHILQDLYSNKICENEIRHQDKNK